MKITKYRQSCVVIEKDDGGRLLIDPGEPAVAGADVKKFGPIDAVFYTHSHYDHCDSETARALLDEGAMVYGNTDVARTIGGDLTRIVDNGETFNVAGFSVLAVELEHMLMIDGAVGPPNTGFVFDGFCFHPGDGLRLPSLRVPVILLPIAGPSVSFRDAYTLVKETGAGTAIPIHYDVFMASPELFAARCEIAQVIVLQNGETALLESRST